MNGESPEELKPDNSMPIEASELYRGTQLYKLHHRYDIGDRSVYVESKTDPSDAAAYLQFKAEELSGDEGISLSNLAVGNALVCLYGCTSGRRSDKAKAIDLYEAREERCGDWYSVKMKGNPDLHREDSELLTFLKPHFGDQ